MGSYDATREEIADLLRARGEPPYRARQVWDGMYRLGIAPSELTVLPKRLRSELAREPLLAPALAVDAEVSSDGGDTLKWLWRLRDGRRIESVLMHYPGRSTVCVSTQAGCAMACGFCATGQAGFERHLSAGEIVEQVVRARGAATASGRRLSNVVFMGMGEPLANYDAVWSAVEAIHGDIGLSARHLTISTVGLVPGIRRLATESLPVNLAVSLHAADDTLRDRLVPINRRYPLGVLAAACDAYVSATRRRLSLEWALVAGVNDRDVDARQLAAFALPLAAHVNLIPLNPTPGYLARGTTVAGVARFAGLLGDLGVNVTVRHTRGADIDAACGQLRASAAERVEIARDPRAD